MPLVDIATITGRAAWVRQKAGLADAGPPYHTHDLFSVFPNMAVAGAKLPRGVIEMAERRPDGGKVLWYARDRDTSEQRVALAHGLYHFMTDLRQARGVRECNVGLRALEAAGKVAASPIEIACDLFAGELLVPFVVLDQVAPARLYPPDARDLWRDQVDKLSSLFNVPQSFMLWRLHDLALLRRSHFFVR